VVASYIVLLAELLGERSAHDVAADGRAGTEVGFARLAPRGGETWYSVRVVCDSTISVNLPLSTLVILGDDEGLSRGVVFERWPQFASIAKLPERGTWRPDFDLQKSGSCQPCLGLRASLRHARKPRGLWHVGGCCWDCMPRAQDHHSRQLHMLSATLFQPRAASPPFRIFYISASQQDFV
jgi:hypothetical protein